MHSEICIPINLSKNIKSEDFGKFFAFVFFLQSVCTELQSSVDRLLGEKIQLTAQVELLKKEKEDLKDKVMA